jgi:WD repeat-containing protein 19
MLMRPEYRKDVNATYRKKIETIVRRPQQAEEEESLSPCPYCDQDFSDYELNCPSCRNTIPYCITTGRHMVGAI